MVWHCACGQGLAGCAGCAERENSGIKLQMELLQSSEVKLVQLA